MKLNIYMTLYYLLHDSTAWHYQEKLFVDTSMYNNLKLPNTHDGNIVLPHMNTHQSAYPDSTSHLLHTSQATTATPSSTTSVAAVAAATASHLTVATVESASLPSSYHTNYGFRGVEPVVSVSSSETEYVINSNVVTSNQSHAAATTSVLASSTTGLHQRRGSLQLWQFLVALLDEPAAR